MNVKRMVAFDVCRDDCEELARRLRNAAIRMRHSASTGGPGGEVYEACASAYDDSASGLERQVDRFRAVAMQEENCRSGQSL